MNIKFKNLSEAQLKRIELFAIENSIEYDISTLSNTVLNENKKVKVRLTKEELTEFLSFYKIKKEIEINADVNDYANISLHQLTSWLVFRQNGFDFDFNSPKVFDKFPTEY